MPRLVLAQVHDSFVDLDLLGQQVVLVAGTDGGERGWPFGQYCVLYL